MEKKQNYTAAIIVMFTLFFMIALVTNLAGSMGVIVTNQFGASKALSQLGTFATFIAYACMGIPAGLILKRKGYKFTALAAVAVGIVGVTIQFLSGYVESFGIYVLGAFVAGFSMCMLDTVVNPLLNTLGGGGKRGNQLIQFGACCNSIGGTFTPVFVGWLVGGSLANATVKTVAPVMIIAIAIFAIAFVIISRTNIPEPHMETAQERAARKAGNVARDPYGPMSFRHFVLGAICVFFYAGIELGIPNTANVYFSQTALGPALTGTFIGFFWACMLVGRLIGAPLSGKVSSKTLLAFAASLAAALILAAMFIPESVQIIISNNAIPVSLVLITLSGLCTSVMWGTIFNLSAEGLGKYTAKATGIFMTLVCGGGIIPLLQGWIAERIGSINSYWLQVACLSFLIFYALVGSRNVNKNIPTDENNIS